MTVYDLQIEPVTDAWLTVRIEVSSVLILDLTCRIDDDDALIDRFGQRLDSSQSAFYRDILVTVRHDGYVRVDHVTSHYLTFMRFNRAISAFAASLNASPMKRSGQFSMLP